MMKTMTAFSKFVCRWILGTTAATMLSMVALPSAGQAQELTICVSPSGKVRGVNVECNSQQTQVGPFETVGPQGSQGPQGVQGPAGFAGAQGAAGGPGIQGAAGAQGPVGPTGDPGAAGAVGLTGPDGPQGNPGIQGIAGIPGNQGSPGTNGTNGGDEPQLTFLTGGTLGTLGANVGINLGGGEPVSSNAPAPAPSGIFLGPGNGSATDPSVAVPMNNPGVGFNLFVNVDNNPGTDIFGAPISYEFVLLDLTTDTSGPICFITDPDTTCTDIFSTTDDALFYSQGDLMVLVAISESPFANSTDVKWSVDYELIVG
jgi:Collagen triple helix repeat (20 copies)